MAWRNVLGSWTDFRCTSAKIAAMDIFVLVSINMKDMINDVEQRDMKVGEKNLREDSSSNLSQSKRIF